MAATKYTRAWLDDAISRNDKLGEAFDRIAGSDKTKQEWLKQACIDSRRTYENFSTGRTLARKDLQRLQARVNTLFTEAYDALNRSREDRDRVWAHIYGREFVDRQRIALYEETRLTSAQLLAEMAGYLAHKRTPLNAALLPLLAIAGDAKVAALATQLLVVPVTRGHVHDVREASGIAVARRG
jgi:hypothetical protein